MISFFVRKKADIANAGSFRRFLPAAVAEEEASGELEAEAKEAVAVDVLAVAVAAARLGVAALGGEATGERVDGGVAGATEVDGALTTGEGDLEATTVLFTCTAFPQAELDVALLARGELVAGVDGPLLMEIGEEAAGAVDATGVRDVKGHGVLAVDVEAGDDVLAVDVDEEDGLEVISVLSLSSMAIMKSSSFLPVTPFRMAA